MNVTHTPPRERFLQPHPLRVRAQSLRKTSHKVEATTTRKRLRSQKEGVIKVRRFWFNIRKVDSLVKARIITPTAHLVGQSIESVLNQTHKDPELLIAAAVIFEQTG